MQIEIKQAYGDGYIDYVDIEPSGLMTLRGWYPDTDIEQPNKPKIQLNDIEIPFHQTFRFFRPDVAHALQTDSNFLGLNLNFLDTKFKLPSDIQHHLRITWNETIWVEQNIEMMFSQPHYAPLLHTEEVGHRHDIYGSGLPSPESSQEIIELSQRCIGKTLDFGCGSGFMVKTLRERGLDAKGIELSRPEIHTALSTALEPHITLYDGQFPLPFEDQAFDTVFTSEVLEHIVDYQTALQEIVRICKQRLIITVPDISAIPIGFYQGVVPWHLLESTHFNFFTQDSLNRLLKPYFAQIHFFKISPVQVNNSQWYTSLAAVCDTQKS